MPTSRVPNIGTVTKGPSRGKVVVEWTVCADPRSFRKTPEAQPFSREDAVVKVYMTGLSFRAESPFLSAPLEHTDIGQLHAQVQEQVRERLALRSGLPWQRYLRVEVRQAGSSHRDAKTRGTEIGYQPIWYAQGPDGKKYTVHESNHVVVELAPELSPGDAAERAGDQSLLWLSNDILVTSRFYVPLTEQNIAAIERIQSRFDELSSALGDLLRPGQAEQVLANLPPAGEPSTALLGWVARS